MLYHRTAPAHLTTTSSSSMRSQGSSACSDTFFSSFDELDVGFVSDVGLVESILILSASATDVSVIVSVSCFANIENFKKLRDISRLDRNELCKPISVAIEQVNLSLDTWMKSKHFPKSS